MMISPECYLKEIEDASYDELIEERDDLLKSIIRYETLEKKGDRSGGEWQINPMPDVRYQMNLEYLSKLCAFMREKYNEEYVWGDKSLCENQREE